MHWLFLSAAVCLAGCGFTEDVAAARLGVYGGTPSAHDSVGFLFGSGSGCMSAGVFLSTRHFLVGGCVDSSDLLLAVPDGNRTPMIYTTAIATHPGPATGIMVGSEEATVHILVTAAEMPVTRPAPLATAVPAVDDTLTVTGFGTGSGGPDVRGAREGPVRVTRVTDGGADFSFVGVGEVRACRIDAPIFDATGNLTGLGVSAAEVDPVLENCFAESTALSMSPLASWVAEILAMPVPAPVPAPRDDAGTDDGGAPDADPSDASADADTSVDVTPSGGGCWCAAPGDGRGDAGWLFAVLGIFAWRLRRNTHVAHGKKDGARRSAGERPGEI